MTTQDEAENKLVTAIAALVPAEVIAAHALVLSRTTMTDKAGTTAITDAGTLQASLVWLMLAAVGAFLIGRWGSNWERADFVRLLIPPAAFVVWTTLIGTSAITPWVAGSSMAVVVLAGVVFGVLLIAVNTRVNPPNPAPPPAS
jgi:hypothetical protein